MENLSKEQFSDEKIQVGVTYLDNKIIEKAYTKVTDIFGDKRTEINEELDKNK